MLKSPCMLFASIRNLCLTVVCVGLLAEAEPVKPTIPPPTREITAQRLGECPPLAFVQRSEYGMTGTNATMFAHRTGVGSAMVIRQPDGSTKTIFETKTGFIWNLSPA